ncbi:MAG: chemotaxis protein CheD [Rhodoferax sp.]|nr:chemotaxis protein CheD [Rhodoferax sp.]MDP3653470.1 chemotaxis protein CheD [Rhodoferax sp.]
MATLLPPMPFNPSAFHPAAVELMPGDVALGLAGDQLKTLLGSCVSVILTDPRRTVAAMCHIVHVGRPNASNACNTAYGEVAMDEMFVRLLAVGLPPTRCQAYVFGGGNMFPQMYNATHVGGNNVEWVLDFLHDHGIAVVGHCLGGNGYRKVSWTVGLGEPLAETVFFGIGCT